MRKTRIGMAALFVLAGMLPPDGARLRAEEPAVEAARQRPQAAAVGGPASGRLEGLVVLGQRLSSRKMRFHLYQDAVNTSTPPPEQPGEEMDNVVVYLEGVTETTGAPRPAAPLAVRQEGLSFVPHVLPVVRGSSVEFPNGDPIFHNVFSLSSAASFDLGRYPRGSSKTVRFDTPGVVKVFCHIHSDMSAVILVLDNRFYVSPDHDGRFRIDGIPPGEYRAVAWHERARPVGRRITIEPGKSTFLDFRIPLSEAVQGG